MIKRILSVILSALLVLSLGIVCVTATTGTNQIYFDLNSTGWENVKQVYCHIWSYDSSDGLKWLGWQAKKEKCVDEGNGIWSYDISKTGNEFVDNKTYCVIFSANTGAQTYDLCFDTTCIGDTAYCDGTIYENPVDSSKTTRVAFWKSGNCGPVFKITSIGNVVGTYIPVETSPQEMYDSFCNDVNPDTGLTALENAVIYNPEGLSADEIAANIYDALGLGKEPVPDPEPQDKKYIAFDSSTVDWGDIEKIYALVYPYFDEDEAVIPEFGSKTTLCENKATDVWAYDLSKLQFEIEDGKTYCVIFYDEDLNMTYDLAFNTACIGDVAYCDGTNFSESFGPSDSAYQIPYAYWKSGQCGPVLSISYLGNVAGSYIPPETSAQELYDEFVSYVDPETGMSNAEMIVDSFPDGRTAEQIEADLYIALGLSGPQTPTEPVEDPDTQEPTQPSLEENPTESKDDTASPDQKPTQKPTDASSKNNKAANNSVVKTGSAQIIAILLSTLLLCAGVVVVARKKKIQ